MEIVEQGDETKFWMLVPGILESVARSEDDIAAGRTYGRAAIVAELAQADVDYDAGNAVSGEELKRRYRLQ